MWTYTTLDGRLLDLTRLTDAERAYWHECVTAYRAGQPWGEFMRLVEGTGSPLVRAAGGRVTRAVWEHPLFQAAYDLEDRLGIAQGRLTPENDADFSADPLADEWLPTSAAARLKRVTLQGLHGAVARGDVVARPCRPGGTRLLVSANSLARWQPMAVRQAAGRKRKQLQSSRHELATAPTP